MKDETKAKDKLIEELKARVAELESYEDKLILELRLQGEIMSNMAEGVVLIRASDGIILYCNPKFEQMFAYNAGELIGKNISVANAPTGKKPKEVAEEIQESLIINKFWQGEVRNIKKTGELFWCSATVSTFEDTSYGTVWISIHTDITQTKKAQEEFNRFFYRSMGLLCICGIDGYFKMLSPSFEKTLGYTVEELQSKPFLEFVHPGDVEASTYAIKQASQGFPLVNFENRYLCKDGTYKHLSWMVLPVPEEGIAYCTAHDVTEQKETQETITHELALQSSIAKVTEALLNPIYNKYDISKIVHDESLILTGSEHGYAALIDEAGDSVAYHFTDMMDEECKIAKERQTTRFPKGQDGYNALWGHSLNTGESFFTNTPKGHPSYKNCMPPGHVEIKNFLSVPAKAGNKVIVQIALANSTRDYTKRDLSMIERLASIFAVAVERKELEDKLRESEQKFRIIFEKAPIGVAITEADTGNFVQVNEEYCYIIGYSCEELTCRTFQDVTHRDDVQRQLDGLERLHRGEISVFSMEKRYIHKSNKIIWVTATSVPLDIRSNHPEFNLTLVEDITYKKEIAAALKERELDVIEAQAKAHFGTWTRDIDSQESKWSLELYNIWGVDPKQGPLLYPALRDHIHPEDLRRFDDAVRESIELCKPYELEIRICRPDKTEKIIHIIGEPALDAAGKVVKLRGSNQDITERKNLEAKLEEVRAQLQSIIDSTTAVVFLKDLQGRYLFINSHYETLFHVTKEGVVGMTDYDIFPKELADNFRANDKEVEKKRVPINFDERVLHDDGLHTYISIKFPLFDTKGKLYGVCGIATDITERKRMEEALRIEIDARHTAEKRLRLLLDASFEGISITEKGQIIDANKRLAEIYGYDQGEVIGMSVFDTATPQYRDTLLKYVSEGYDKPYEMDCLKKDGTIISVEVCGKNMEYEGRRIRVAAIRDITQRKKMELQLKKLNEHLMELVTEETQKRQQQEQLLIQQSKMADMGEMIGLIAHQWRQPLNAIGMVVQDIKEAYNYGELSEDYIKNTVDTTMKQVFFMSKTIEDFKDFFKPAKEKVRFNVKSAIEGIISMFEHLFKKSDVDVSVRTGQDTMLFTDGYPNEFKQVILNIMNNSKDAITSKRESGDMIQGRIEINIINNIEINKVIISISDNGGGIPGHIIDKIFDPYYTTKGEKGTGIGLYMSKTIIETNMGGSLEVSNVDGGAKFVIELDI
ncbi:MAG: PAS domain S-box protein [Nitrospirae bacterium]|nr:PAS domain S-box protein [Nitrospirota bacterium]